MIDMKEESLKKSLIIKERYLELKKELKDINEIINSTVKEFRHASSQGDLSENAAYTEAKEKLVKLYTQKSYILEDIEYIENNISDITYVPKSYIDVNSTFLIRRLDNQKEEIWKVNPGTIVDPIRGILSTACPIYQEFKGREKGDIIKTKNRVTGQTVEFQILDVY